MRQSSVTQVLKMLFGIFMVLVYLCMAVLMAIDLFNLGRLRWLFAVVFAAYGLYRGYREIKGEHTYGMRRYDESADDEERYTTYNKKEDNDEKE